MKNKNYCGWGEMYPPFWQDINEACEAHDADYDEFISWWEKASGFWHKFFLFFYGLILRFVSDFLFLLLCFYQLPKIKWYLRPIASICFVIYYVIISLVAWLSWYNIKPKIIKLFNKIIKLFKK